MHITGRSGTLKWKKISKISRNLIKTHFWLKLTILTYFPLFLNFKCSKPKKKTRGEHKEYSLPLSFHSVQVKPRDTRCAVEVPLCIITQYG